MRVPNDCELRWIEITDPLFDQVKSLRYRVLHEPFGVPKGIDFKDWDPASSHLVALRNGRPIGYGRLVRHENAVQIRHLCVTDECRGEGVGAKLLDALVSKARESGAPLVFLNARFNALGLYRSRGFTEVGGFTHTENTFIPHKRMERTL